MIARNHPAWQWIFWILVILLLPFTSFPLVARFIRSTMVAPASLLAVTVLAAGWFLPYLLRRGGLPAQSRPLLAFIAIALIASLTASFLPIPIFRDTPVLFNSIEGLVTLAIGVLFFLLAALWPNQEDDLRRSLRWINWSGAIIIVWSFVQAGIWYLGRSYPEWLYTLQNAVSTSGNLYHQRVTGMAYEPSWLAHQLNMLYLPLWLSASVFRHSAHQRRLGFLTFENVLLAGGLATLFLSFSRIGWLAFLTSAAFLLLLANVKLIRWAQARLITQDRLGRFYRIGKVTLTIVMLLVLIAAYLAIFLGAGFALSKLDPRMATLFDLNIFEANNFAALANRLVFAERVVFWEVGWDVFDQFPWLGVGLGNSGYFFTENLSSFSWGLPEVRTLMYHQSHIPNTKNLWVRLLSETGIVGFSVFIAWLFTLWQTGQMLRRQKAVIFGVFGLAGLLTLVAFIIEGFSLDSFALPYYWLSFGLLVAAYRIARQKNV
ncbi:MAG TPA: O-antigen ligase family protein [Anaerolineaceae bacterium]|nr:O-antigen ligase family protein [Anaerolineaceae bacterium]